MIIYHNIPALNSWRNLAMTNSSMAKSLEKLSSGLRINRAADDAAGLAISEKMRAQIRGLNQAVRNAQDGISLIQTAEGALNESHSILQRMRELAVQAANDTLTSSDRAEIQKEVDQLTAELNRIANTTEFNTKKLLDGSASALTSSDKLTTKIFMRDGLRTTDQYGQKVTNSGNYELRIGVKDLGQSEVQKSDVFNVKHAYNGVENLQLGADGTNNTLIGARNYVGGGYTLGTTFSASVSEAHQTQQFTSGGAGNIAGGAITDPVKVAISGQGSYNYNALIEITNVIDNTTTFDVTYRVSTHRYGIDGAYEFMQQTVTQTITAASAAMIKLDSGFTGVNYIISGGATASTASLLKVGDKAVINANSEVTGSSHTYTLLGVADGDNQAHTVTQSYASGYFDKTQRTFNLYSLDTFNGTAYNGSITVGFDYDYAGAMDIGKSDWLALDTGGPPYTIDGAHSDGTKLWAGDMILFDMTLSSGITYKTGTILTQDLVLAQGDLISTLTAGGSFDILRRTDSATGTLTATAAVFNVTPAQGRAASLDTRLYDIDKFWDANGNFLLRDPQQITLIQGDGKKASITLDSNDTVFTVQQKLNNAIRDGLGQSAYVETNLERNFVQFVYNNQDTPFENKSAFSVNGTFVIQSAIAGKAGEIRLVGDDNLINAFSLANIRNSSENTFNVWYKDAHSTTPYDIAPNATIAGNLLVGVIHPNVDVMFDSNASIGTIDKINTATGLFMFKAETNPNNYHTTTVHLADNTMVFQIGANPNQDVNASIGDMSALALGVNNVIMTDRNSATTALSKIDQAINRVSGERAKMGALQNRLEHTINNLGVAAENLSAAESRIRDVDMAAEMMNLTKLQILAQAGTAMMAQANAMPQMVLRLLGG